ncbi:hypothetical protein AA309_02605 [Microvirga vignae]|uniref:Uncharacterized protein n=1 Tax=Microvirga vignae TaxID=1225564 RepID=A0A0H1RIB6_9HYPH|nr:hypothetical protein AA309_02605 [Microvirga vignae]
MVVECSPRQGGFTNTHERTTQTEIAKRLAALMGFAYAGEYDPSDACFGRVCFVPSDTFRVLILQDQDVLGYGMLVQYPAWGVY